MGFEKNNATAGEYNDMVIDRYLATYHDDIPGEEEGVKFEVSYADMAAAIAWYRSELKFYREQFSHLKSELSKD